MEQDKLKAAIIKAQEGQEGQEEGFNLIYKETYNYVYFRAKKFVHNDEDTWDVVQEVYTAAFKTISQLKNPDSLYAWLGGITYNLSMRSFRKKREELITEEEEGIFEQIEMKDRELHPEKAFEDKATSRIIKELIEELPELQQGALMAYYYDEMSVGDIANHFECSTGTIKSRLNYARKYLKEAIEQREKKEGFVLHGFSIPSLLLAFQFMASENIATTKAAEAAYACICNNLGIKAVTLALGTTAVQGVATEGMAVSGTIEGAASIQATGTQAAAALKGTGAILEGAEKVGVLSKIAALSAGAKVTVAAVGITAVTLTGVGVNHYVQNNNPTMESMEPEMIPSETPSQVPTGIPSAVPTEEPMPTLILSPTPAATPTPTLAPTPALSASLQALSGYLTAELQEKGIITEEMINNGEADNGGIFYAAVMDDESMEEPTLLTAGLVDIKRYDWGYESTYYSYVYYPGNDERKQMHYYIYSYLDNDPDTTDTGKLSLYIDTVTKKTKGHRYFGDHYHPEDTAYGYNDQVDTWMINSYETVDRATDYILYKVNRSGRNRDVTKNGYYKDPDIKTEYDEFPVDYDGYIKITETDILKETNNPGRLIFQSIGDGKIEIAEKNTLSKTMDYLLIEEELISMD